MDTSNLIVPLDMTTVAEVANKGRPTLDVSLRNLRNTLLKENVDTFNPIRYASLTVEQQQELSTYRQALLDVTKQTSWPNDIVWPTPPDFV